MARTTRQLSPLECRVLSELIAQNLGAGGVSPTKLAHDARLSRSTLYVLLRRLARAKCVRRLRERVPGRNEYAVYYNVTAAGRKARERFARSLGLWP